MPVEPVRCGENPILGLIYEVIVDLLPWEEGFEGVHIKEDVQYELDEAYSPYEVFCEP